MNYSIVTPPVTEPLTLAEVKLFLRVDQNVEDALITALIVAARQWVENYTWRPLITQTWKLNIDHGEVTDLIGLNKSPVSSVTSIVYYNLLDSLTTLTTGDFQTDILNDPARIKFSTKPDTFDKLNTMSIQFVCGYGAASAVPDAIKQAIYLMIGHWYEHREAVSVGQFQSVPMTCEALLMPYKNTSFYPYNFNN